jgi:hypothetical protein
MAFREAVGKFGYEYVETQAGVDRFSRPKDELVHPDLFLEPSGKTVIVKSLVTSTEDQYTPEELLAILPLPTFYP